MKSDTVRYMHLEDELDASVKLIKSGFGFLQDINFANEFYHPPHQLLASGLERFMKSYISAVIHDRTKDYPDINGMKKIGHDLCDLRTKIMDKYFTGLSRPLIRTEQLFVLSDKTLGDCLRVLSDFGKKGRYYNLDVVAGSDESLIDPKKEWEEIERSILDPLPYFQDPEAMQRDYYPRVNQAIIARLERFLRAISFQFTLGDDSTVGSKVRKLSVFVTDFLDMKDAEFGTKDYRKRTKVKPVNWQKSLNMRF